MKFSTKVQQTERNIKYIWIFPRDHIHSNLQTNTNVDARRAKLMYNLVENVEDGFYQTYFFQRTTSKIDHFILFYKWLVVPLPQILKDEHTCTKHALAAIRNRDALDL